MSSAFDTIDRRKLLENTKDIFGRDAWRMTEQLLTKTTLEARYLNATSKPFISNVGSPQGDALSSILFTIYLECALRELRSATSRPRIDICIPLEISYADGVDFISGSKEYLAEVKSIVSSSIAA